MSDEAFGPMDEGRLKRSGDPLEFVGGKLVFRGPIASIRMDTFRYEDGQTAERQIVVHPGAVGIVAYDEQYVYMVRQPREAVDAHDMLEIPAGTRDVEGEEPLATAKRELGEEIGMGAREWRELKRFYATPGISSEEVILYLATGLTSVDRNPPEGERITIEPVPLSDLDGTIARCLDAKSMIGLLLLRNLLRN